MTDALVRTCCLGVKKLSRSYMPNDAENLRKMITEMRGGKIAENWDGILEGSGRHFDWLKREWEEHCIFLTIRAFLINFYSFLNSKLNRKNISWPQNEFFKIHNFVFLPCLCVSWKDIHPTHGPISNNSHKYSLSRIFINFPIFTYIWQRFMDKVF